MNWKIALAAVCAVTPLWIANAEDKKEPPKPKLASVEGFEYDGSTINSVRVTDMKRSKAWYTDVLGANVYYELAEQGWCEMTSPCANAIIGLNLVPDSKPAAVNAMSFGVKDMAKAKAWLVKKSVKLEGDVIEIPTVVKLLYFTDPDGNRLMFYQPLNG
jgi:catechol 2,3-dioxygenase-like lactoylglutathione lyase family enzyme